MKNSKIKVGSVCKCANDRLGIVTVTYKPIGCQCPRCQSTPVVKGIGLNGLPWRSASPTFIAENVEEYMKQHYNGEV